MKRIILAIASCLAVAGFSGCALTTEHIDLQYTKQKNVSPIPGASNVIVSVKVSDERQDKTKVSNKKNGYGMIMAPIIANEDIAVTIRRAIEQELGARGFKLGADNALVQIAADVTRFYNEHRNGFFSGDAVADLNMSVIVKSKTGALLYSHALAVQGTEPNTQLASGENAKLALDRALENGMKALFEDQAFLSALTTASK